MGSLLLLCAVLFLLNCPCSALWTGTDFALSFMQNYRSNYDTPSFQLFITAAQADSKVTVEVPSLNYKQVENIKSGQSVTFTLPNKVELYGTGKCSKTVRIKASAQVAVTSSNNKLYTTDTSVILPTSDWGTEYFIFTPRTSPYGTYKEFAVTNGKDVNTVSITLKGTLRYEQRVYRSGSRLQLDLQPYESVQLQSTEDLSGSQIASTKPVAVFSGHSCTWRFSKCNHVYEQLLPVSKWGTSFIVPPLSIQKKYDSVYVQASQNTQVTVQTDKGKDTFSLNRGGTKEITYSDPTTLFIEADHAVQVLFLFNGVSLGRNNFYDPFLMNIVPMNRFCSAYTLTGLNKFDNQALIVAKTNEMLEVKLDGVVPREVQWRRVEGTDYSWVKISYSPTRDGSGHTVSSSGSSFGLYSVGVSQMNGYGAPGQCIESDSSGGGSISCNDVTCSNNELCQMDDGFPSCVTKPKKPGMCWALGDPHYRTFDGRRFDFMGTCTYVIAKNCEVSDSLPAFEVLAQNENRGSTKVSYVGVVIVKVSEVTIMITRSDNGYARIQNTRWALPITLKGGKLTITQSGRSAVIDTDFGLSVRYDWDNSLVVSLSDAYSGKTCGLCGNFNGNPKDDFSTPSGTQVGGAVAFGSSWKVPGLVPNVQCKDDCVGGCGTCQHNLMKKWEGELFCGIITMTTNGPFSKCHSVIDPKDYFENCVYDVCMGEGLRRFLCKALEAYADACQDAGVEVQDWRKISKCPAKCKANSHYELCGSACPATCSDPDAPSKCKRPCLGTCVCNKGFVLSGNKCVQTSKCGCNYEGRYVPAGKSFYADQGCKKWCKCDPKSQKVVCKDKGCKKGEMCKVVDGIRKCAAVSSQTCQATGDPHYKSFDDRRFNFQGTCVYQLAALCSKDPDLVPFEVLVQNDNRGSKVVSYTKLVEVKVFSLSIVITRTHKGRIMVNNELVNLPITFEDEEGDVNVYKSGWYAVVDTNFGLRVAFNWENAVYVTLSSNYMGAVCGLCGNYNGKPWDDLIPKNGNSQVSSEDFGASWRVAEIPGCVDGCKGTCPDCDITEKVQYEKNDFCGIITDPKGPFRDCNATVDSTGYFEDCVFDVCLYDGRKDVLCQAITAYAAACQEAGAKVYSWRTNEFCAIKCPVHSHYDICGDSCPTTCQGLTPPQGCKPVCEEGCVCDEDHILSGDSCVPFSQCGCEHEDRYYRIGEVFYPNGQCEEECKCGQDGEVECKKFSCGPNEKCIIENGVRKCHPVGKGVCQASGDPHYTSFDGRKFDFQGTCTYTLSQSCGVEGTNLKPFSVQVENVEWTRNRRVSVTRLVAVNAYNMTFILRSNMFGVLVNGIFHDLPLNINDGAVLVYKEGTYYVIETDFGLKVSYNLVYHAAVTVPGNYRDKVCGLCGNFNGDRKDDFQLPNKQLANNVNKFGASWKVTIPNVVCSNGCEGNNCPNCDKAHKEVFSRNTYCGIMTAPKGPFAACHSKLDPQPYFDDCVFDVCVSNGDGKVLCDSVAAYAFNCHMAGVDVKSWRSPSFCPMKCPANSHYEVCADYCSAACPGLTDIIQCQESCTEGCECDTGFLFNGDTCVKDKKCGCYDEGKTYKPGEVVYNDDCTTKCMCNPTKGLVCEKHSCPQGTTCTVKKGIQGCYNTDPCKDAKCRVKEKCQVEKGDAVCVPEYIGACWAWGDPHYHTYDNYNFDFQGTCRYVISQTCGDLDGLVPFSITERNDNRGNKAVSYVRDVEVSVYGYIIVVRKNEVGRVSVDGELLNLPVLLDEEDRVVSIVQKGSEAEIKTDFGLIVTYDWNWKLVIKLPSSYYGLVCGLCGNFNGNSRDERQNRAGKAVSIAEWGKSWQTAVQDKDSPCQDSCDQDCPACDEEQRKLYETEDRCGALTAKAGVFAKCHDKVDPDAFMSSCVFDMCLNDGDKKMLCQALASYSQQCREEGVIIKSWRQKFGCPMNCQRHSHYEECASPCQPSCPFPEQKEICTSACVETCVCDKGYVLSAGVCVPAKSCGCSYQGHYYKPGQRFWEGEDCGRLCQCDTTLGMVVCKEAACSAKEKCTVVDGVRACRPTSQAICSASGDPHYRTFDGRKFDFQGTCVYQLVALCSQNPELEPFNVTVQNENRGNNKAVSFTRTVTFTIYDVTLTLSREYPNRVLRDGQLESLPLEISDDLRVVCGGNKAVVETAAGITVTFDWRSAVSVTVPSNYQSAVCGLCGNYNGKPQDDLTMRDGQAAADGVKLGESWQVALVPGCSSVCQGPWCHACSDSQSEVYKAQEYCGIIADKKGPFKNCHSRVNPALYMEDCVFDACQYNGHQGAVCDAISTYVSACQSAGVTILSWRAETFCPMACPANSHYTLCATSCPATCASLTSVNCNRPCTETCECDEGFLLSGDTCVPVKDCGCSYDGHYYRTGDVFYPENECVEKCVCGDNGAVSCQKAKCRPGETCKVVNGVKGCHPEGQGKCVASGDPHYTSYDGRRFDFQGTCVYTLSKVCDDDKGQLTPFTVTQGNEKYGNGKVAVTKSVGVAVYGFDIYIQQRVSWEVIVDDELINLPLSLHDGRIRITQEGRNIIVRTDFGLTVLYDTVYYVEVIVPSTYMGKMCGLCGNYNKNPKDDFMLPGGRQNNDVDEFGKAWVVDLPGFVCGGCGAQCPVCDQAKETLFGKPDSCGIISAPNGPFKACHSKIDPAAYVSNCVFDVCAMDGNKETLCDSVLAYALACQNEGVQIRSWRTDSFCPASCPENSHYELCADTCGVTCASLINPVSCSKACFEGCQCDHGFVFDGIQCVSMESCGCEHNGRYLKVGEAVVDRRCKSKCVCQSPGTVKCEKLFCGSGEVCEVRNGVRGCHGGQGQCVITAAGHLTSFDGMSGPVGAAGAFEAASWCDLNSELWFRVVVDVRSCRKGALSVDTVYMFFRNATIAVNSQQGVWVNGRNASLPTTVGCDISVEVLDRSVVIRRGTSVRVTYSISQEVTVIVDSGSSYKTCGACGNYNNDSKDDMTTADGKTSTKVSVVVASWRAGDFSNCGL